MKARFCSVLLIYSLAFPALANEFKNTDKAIKYRDSVFHVIAHNFSNIGAMIKGKKAYDAQAIVQRAYNIQALSHMALEGFIANSDKGDTEAKADIWQNKADFEQKMQNFQFSAAKLAKAAVAENKKEVKQAFSETAKTCKACHKLYKED